MTVTKKIFEKKLGWQKLTKTTWCFFIKLENQYLSEDEHYKVRMQISRLQGEKMAMIKSIKNKEKLYSRTVKEGEGKMAFKQNDQNYIAFANQPKTTYVNTQGQTMQVPQSVGGKF